jgi:NAD+ synthase
VEEEAARISEWIKRYVIHEFKRRGGVVGVSGGIDSSLVLALAVRALGSQNVTAFSLPEKDSSPESLALATELSNHFGVKLIVDDISPALEGLGCYTQLTESIREAFPDYDPAKDKVKLVLPDNLLDKPGLNVFSLALLRPGEPERKKILPPHAYLGIVATTNMKQRTRMMRLYFQAERRNFAVIGTSNRNEHDQGFFVKYGDGGVDIQPIRHLLKTQVYQLLVMPAFPKVSSNARRPRTHTARAAPRKSSISVCPSTCSIEFGWAWIAAWTMPPSPATSVCKKNRWIG